MINLIFFYIEGWVSHIKKPEKYIFFENLPMSSLKEPFCKNPNQIRRLFCDLQGFITLLKFCWQENLRHLKLNLLQ